MGGIEVSALVVALEKHHGESAGVPFFHSRCVGHKLMHHVQLFLYKPIEGIYPAYTGDGLQTQFIMRVPLPDMRHFMAEYPFAITIRRGYVLSPE